MYVIYTEFSWKFHHFHHFTHVRYVKNVRYSINSSSPWTSEVGGPKLLLCPVPDQRIKAPSARDAEDVHPRFVLWKVTLLIHLKHQTWGGVVNLLGFQAELNETRVFVAIIYEKVKGCLKSIGETSSNNHILETLPIVTLWCFFAEKWWMCLTIPSLEMGGECQFYMICQSSKSPTGDEGTARWRSNCWYTWWYGDMVIWLFFHKSWW